MHDSHRRQVTSKTVRETEAEAFVVCHALGLDCSTRSSDYIQLYRGTAETLSDSLQLIQRTAAELIETLRTDTEMDGKSTRGQAVLVPLTQRENHDYPAD